MADADVASEPRLWHMGRCWSGDEKEWFGDECTCTEMAPCGASITSNAFEQNCPQHSAMRSMRRMHPEDACRTLNRK